jgi:hypothetical protein
MPCFVQAPPTPFEHTHSHIPWTSSDLSYVSKSNQCEKKDHQASVITKGRSPKGVNFCTSRDAWAHLLFAILWLQKVAQLWLNQNFNRVVLSIYDFAVARTWNRPKCYRWQMHETKLLHPGKQLHGHLFNGTTSDHLVMVLNLWLC